MNPWMCPRCKRINSPVSMQCVCSEMTNPFYQSPTNVFVSTQYPGFQKKAVDSKEEE